VIVGSGWGPDRLEQMEQNLKHLPDYPGVAEDCSKYRRLTAGLLPVLVARGST
jgi:hypothetical protein